MQAGGPARHGARVRDAEARGEAPLELRHARPERQLARAQDLEDGLLLRLAEHRPGERDLLREACAPAAAASRAPGCSAYSSESTSACQEAAMTFSATPIEPHVSLAVARVDEHAVIAPVPFGLVEDAHLVVDELDVAQVRVGSTIAERSAASSALTGPLPSAVRT